MVLWYRRVIDTRSWFSRLGGGGVMYEMVESKNCRIDKFLILIISL